MSNNILGYVRITDLGIARILKPENSSDTSGTPGYMGILTYFHKFQYISIFKLLRSCVVKITDLE